MSDLILYLGITLVGYFIGTRARSLREKFLWTGKVQTFAIGALVLSMGIRMGANKEVTQQLGSIGLYAFIMTIVIMAFSILSVFLTRNFLGLDKLGLMKNENKAVAGIDSIELEVEEEGKKKSVNTMTIIIVVAVFLGMGIGYLAQRFIISDPLNFNNIMGLVIKIGLCLLLIFVGFDLGIDGTVIGHFKKVGFRVLVIPFAIILGTLVGGVACSLFMPLSLKEALAVSAGLGWYSLAPGIILEKGYLVASAISFMHNVMREVFSFILIPIVATRIGYVETVALPGAAAMDVCLPIVERSTEDYIAVFSFVSGVVLSIAVPILVPIMLSL